MNKLVADGATGPAASEHGFIPIQPLLTDFAETGLNPQQHWLPIPAGFSDTHDEEYSQAFSSKTRTHVVTVHEQSLFSDASFPLIPFLPLKAFGRERSNFIGEAGTHRDSAEKESWN